MLLARYDGSFIVQLTVITTVKYNHTVIAIVNFDCKTFIVQSTNREALKLTGEFSTYIEQSVNYQI
jgi:hypothetical protein